MADKCASGNSRPAPPAKEPLSKETQSPDEIIRVVVFEPGLPPYERPMRAGQAPWALIGGTSGEHCVEWRDGSKMYYNGTGPFNAAASLFADETICGNAVYVDALESGVLVSTDVESMRERFLDKLYDW